MEEFTFFDEVIGHVSLGKPDSGRTEFLYKICRDIGAKCESSANGVIIRGTLRQLSEIEQKVGYSLNTRASPSTGSLANRRATTMYERSMNTEPYVAMYMQRVCRKELKQMEQNHGIRIRWSDAGTHVTLTSENVHHNNFGDAYAKFKEMYSYFYNEVETFTIDVSKKSKAYSRSDLEATLHQLPDVIGGLILWPVGNGKTYELYGTPAVLTAAKDWIRSQLRIDPSSSHGSTTISPSKTPNIRSYETPRKLKVVVYCGDITKENADVIVNAANEDLYHGGGVSWAISKAGGVSIQQESDAYVRKFGRVATGDVAITKSGNLNCKAILHAVGPQYKVHGKQGSVKALKQICDKIFNICQRYGFKSVAIPAISSGRYGVPRELCAKTILTCFDELDQKASSQPPEPFEIRLVNIDVETAKVFSAEFEKWKLSKGRKVERRNSFHGVREKVKESRQPPRGADDMSSPKIRAPLVPPEKNKVKPLKQKSTASAPLVVSATLLSISKTPSEKPTATGSTVSPKRAFIQDHATKSTEPSISSTQAQGKSSTTISKHGNQLKAKTPKNTAQNDAVATTSASTPDQGPSEDECPICQCTVTNPKVLSKCGHAFCTACIDTAFRYQRKCPICQEVYGVAEGTQPAGTMKVDCMMQGSLQGYEGSGYYYLTYNIPSGTQGARHPNPGQPYHGTRRQAFIPATKEGTEVVELLRKAFDKKLIFTVGRSSTTGVDNCVTWNDIHHKTSMSGGPQRFGYPDHDYLRRVKEELKAKGIVPE